MSATFQKIEPVSKKVRIVTQLREAMLSGAVKGEFPVSTRRPGFRERRAGLLGPARRSKPSAYWQPPEAVTLGLWALTVP